MTSSTNTAAIAFNPPAMDDKAALKVVAKNNLKMDNYNIYKHCLIYIDKKY